MVAGLVHRVDRAVDVAEHAVDERRAGVAAGRPLRRRRTCRRPWLAIVLESRAWSAPRKLTQKRPDRWISGQARDVFAGQNSTSGGSSETLENDWQVMPDRLAVADRGDHGDAGGEAAEHVAEPAGARRGLRVVGRTAMSSPGRNSKSTPVAEARVDQLRAAARSPGRRGSSPPGSPVRTLGRLGGHASHRSVSRVRRRSRGPSSETAVDSRATQRASSTCRPSVPNSTSKPPGDLT